MNRGKYYNAAKRQGVSLAEYLARGIEIDEEFYSFGEEVLNYEYSEEPNYEYLRSLYAF